MNLPGKHVLIVEDNADNMELITFILENYGYQTIRALNGFSGVAAAKAEQYDFIILDIQLPDIDGTEVLKRLRAEGLNQQTPVIAMTSYAMSGDQEFLMASGCDGYIEKPIDPALVIEQINAILEKRR
jgi:two-component system, cell cycle response regulator DivK